MYPRCAFPVSFVCLVVLTMPPANGDPPQGRAPVRTDRYGDPLPAGALVRLGTVRLRHAGSLMHLAFAADGTTLVSTGSDGVRVWEAATGRPLRHFGSGAQLKSVSVSADGSRIALLRSHDFESGTLEIWDTTTGKLPHTIDKPDCRLVRLTPDGKRLAAVVGSWMPIGDTDATVEIWDTKTGRRLSVWAKLKEYAADMRFSADGKTLFLGGSPRVISVCDVASGKEIRRLRNLPGDVYQLAVSGDGRRLAFIEMEVRVFANGGSWKPTRRVFLLDARSGAELRRWTEKERKAGNNSFCGLAFRPDGKKLAACTEVGPVRLWDARSGEEKRILADGSWRSAGLAFSADGRALAVSNNGRTIRLLDPVSGADRVPVRAPQGDITALAVAADGRTACTAEMGTIHRWDTRTGRELGRLSGPQGRVNDLALSAEGKLFSVALDNGLLAWDVREGQSRRLLDKGNFRWGRLKLSPDDKMLAVHGLYPKELMLLDAVSGKRLHRLTTKTWIIDTAFAEDASMVLALTGDRRLCRWQLPAGRRLPDAVLPQDAEIVGDSIGTKNEERIVLSADGRLAAHGFDHRFLRVLDLSVPRQVRRTAKLPGMVWALAFAADGRTLAWANVWGEIHWLELATWSERRKFIGHADAVNQMIFTADGKHLVSGSADATALLWDLYGDSPARLSAKEREACWSMLAQKDAAKAYREMCRLLAAPTDALTLLRSHLKPVAGVDEKRIERLVAELDSAEFTVREKATTELRKLGELTEPALGKAIASHPTLEQRRRMEGLLEEIKEQHWRPSLEILRQLRALEVLERIGAPEARTLLETLAKGASGARLTREARDSLRRRTTLDRKRRTTNDTKNTNHSPKR